VEVIIKNFSEVNGRVHENIKLWCLGSSIGVDLGHLRRLEDDDNSKALGFDLDAKLQMAASNATVLPGTLEIANAALNESLRNMTTTEEQPFGIVPWGEQHLLVEYRKYSDSPIAVELDHRNRDLIDNLAKLLHQPKELVFRTPPCVGWTIQMAHNRCAFLFSIPAAVQPQPTSLLAILKTANSHGGGRAPPLGQRFHLALKLARCISQLQLVKWVHESFRSENILFFPPWPQNGGGADTVSIHSAMDDGLNYSEPWVMGFEFSRPEIYFSGGHADWNISRDVYRHPDRQGKPTQPFNKLHDIYALGVVLLEIGRYSV
jgi:hypothetical protein